MKLTKAQALEVVNSLVSSDAGFESDCVQMDVAQGREVSAREKTLADLVGDIYMVVHPMFSVCTHSDWEEKTREMYEKL